MKKKHLAAAVAAFLAGGALVFAAPTVANAATTPDEFCQAVYETQPNLDYIPEQPEVSHVVTVVDSPEVAEVSHTEYLYKQLITGKQKWLDSLTWNPGLGWYYAGETRTVVDVPYQPAVTHEETIIDTPYAPAIGEPTIQVQTGELCEVWVTWSTSFLVSNPQNANDVAWPQTFLGFGQIAPECGVQVQQDHYVGSREAIDAVLADDTLDGLPPEDSGVVTPGWVFVDGGVCAPEPQEPSVVVTYGEFGGDEPTCEVPEVTWTRERTTVTTPYIVVGDPHTGWSQVLDTEHATTVVDVDEVTEVHSYDGECVSENPPSEEPPTSTPIPATPVNDELAYTGARGDSLLTGTLLGLVVVGAGLGLVALRRRFQ